MKLITIFESRSRYLLTVFASDSVGLCALVGVVSKTHCTTFETKITRFRTYIKFIFITQSKTPSCAYVIQTNKCVSVVV